MAELFYVGSRVSAKVVFRTAAGAAADPSGVVVKYQDPALVETTKTYPDAAVVKDSVGRYHIDIAVALAGTWYVKWEGTGGLQAAWEDHFVVQATQF